MRTDDFIQSYSDGVVTIDRELHVWHLRLRDAREMLASELARQPRDRHFTGEPECEHVVRWSDKVEIAERRIRELERRKALAEEAQAA